jgi:hypothetical protein
MRSIAAACGTVTKPVVSIADNSGSTAHLRALPAAGGDTGQGDSAQLFSREHLGATESAKSARAPFIWGFTLAHRLLG